MKNNCGEWRLTVDKEMLNWSMYLSDHSIIPFNLANEKRKNESIFFFSVILYAPNIENWCLFSYFQPKMEDIIKEETKTIIAIINQIKIFHYCYAISHSTFLLCGHACVVWYLWSLITFSIKHWGKTKISLVAKYTAVKQALVNVCLLKSATPFFPVCKSTNIYGNCTEPALTVCSLTIRPMKHTRLLQ